MVAFPKQLLLFFCWCLWIISLDRPFSHVLHLEVVMESSAKGVMELFVDQGQGFTQDVSSIISISPTILADTHHISLPIKKAIAVRFDPINAEAKIKIEKITLIYGENVLQFAGETLKHWQPSLSLQEVHPEAADRQYREFKATDNDPQLYFKLPPDFIVWSDKAYNLPKAQAFWLIGIGALLLLLANMPQSYKLLSSEKPARATLALAVLIPMLLFWILNYNVLDNWFMADDPCYIEYFQEVNVAETFYIPKKSSSPANFTPLFNLSFWSDFKAFKLEPKYYYWHHLISLTGSVALVFWALSCFLPPFFASAILCSFVVSNPVADAANFLMERHYVEGLGIAAFSVVCYFKAIKSNSFFWAVGGGFLFLAVCIAKEVYVPLACLLPFSVIGPLAYRWRMWIPYGASACLYIVWRCYMLGDGGIVAGYGERGYLTKIDDLYRFPIAYKNLMGLPGIHWAIVFLGLILFAAAVISHKKNRLLTTLFWAGALIVPLIPVVNMLVSRYVFVLTLMLYVTIGFGLYFQNFARYPFLNIAIWLVLIGSGLQAFAQYEGVLTPYKKRAKMEGRFLLKSDNMAAVLIEPLSHCLEAYSVIRQNENGLGQTVGVAPSVCHALTLFPYSKEYYVYNKEQVRPYLGMVPTHDTCSVEFRDGLLVVARYDQNTKNASWILGPYKEGQGNYYIAIENGNFMKLIAPRGVFNMKLDIPLPFVFQVKYIDATGWQTSSPQIAFNSEFGVENGIVQVRWQRSD